MTPKCFLTKGERNVMIALDKKAHWCRLNTRSIFHCGPRCRCKRSCTNRTCRRLSTTLSIEWVFSDSFPSLQWTPPGPIRTCLMFRSPRDEGPTQRKVSWIILLLHIKYRYCLLRILLGKTLIFDETDRSQQNLTGPGFTIPGRTSFMSGMRPLHLQNKIVGQICPVKPSRNGAGTQYEKVSRIIADENRQIGHYRQGISLVLDDKRCIMREGCLLKRNCRICRNMCFGPFPWSRSYFPQFPFRWCRLSCRGYEPMVWSNCPANRSWLVWALFHGHHCKPPWIKWNTRTPFYLIEIISL